MSVMVACQPDPVGEDWLAKGVQLTLCCILSLVYESDHWLELGLERMEHRVPHPCRMVDSQGRAIGIEGDILAMAIRRQVTSCGDHPRASIHSGAGILGRSGRVW